MRAKPFLRIQIVFLLIKQAPHLKIERRDKPSQPHNTRTEISLRIKDGEECEPDNQRLIKRNTARSITQRLARIPLHLVGRA